VGIRTHPEIDVITALAPGSRISRQWSGQRRK